MGQSIIFITKESKVRTVEWGSLRGLPTSCWWEQRRGGKFGFLPFAIGNFLILILFPLHCPPLPPPCFPLRWMWQTFCSEWEKTHCTLMCSGQGKTCLQASSCPDLFPQLPPFMKVDLLGQGRTQAPLPLHSQAAWDIAIALKAAPLPLASQPPIDRPKAQLNDWGPEDSGSPASFWLLEV